MKKNSCKLCQGIGAVLALAGAILLILIMPGWAWLLAAGVLLIAIGAVLIFRCR